MSERVVNLRDFPIEPGWSGLPTEAPRELPPDVARIDRVTPWGNPYKITLRTSREAAIAKYRLWLQKQLDYDPAFLEPLRGKRLACWCAPLPCHGDVIAEYIP